MQHDVEKPVIYQPCMMSTMDMDSNRREPGQLNSMDRDRSTLKLSLTTPSCIVNGRRKDISFSIHCRAHVLHNREYLPHTRIGILAKFSAFRWVIVINFILAKRDNAFQ
ncbi:hypothetical protein CEXT_207851 [Caerostris extrusa]|uniref:Uncharacterized protein n=1 Tax=Caerostris extrusa TaxID=172846 RepID=A0AAV4THE8_CAEEX|nr:hypothetical protein CEXT_207851 [Caerostris extrusa]